MKRLCLIFICAFIFIAAGITAFAKTQSAPILLVYNNNTLKTDVPPLIVENRCLVPARAFFEGIGAQVSWVADVGRVDVSFGDQKISLTIGSRMAYVDGAVVTMDVPAAIISGRTMIPVRFISESFGMKVVWKESPRTVEITKKDAAGIINSVKSSVDDDNLNISIKLSAPPSKYSSFYLSEPSRLVVDIYGAEMGSGISPNMDFTFNGVKKLRIGAHDGYVRFVFDTASELAYNIVKNKAKTDMSIYIAAPGATPPPESPTPPGQTPRPKTGMIVAIDAGHGGTDPGAMVELDGKSIQEKDINLSIALKLKKLLEAKGIGVFMTRDADKAVELRSRPDLCYDAQADLTISVHSNAIASADINGLMTFYAPMPSDTPADAMTSKRLAEIVQKEMLATTKANDMGSREMGGYIVLKYAKMPAIIVEVGFMTNADELKKLIDPAYAQLAAQGLCNGAVKVLDEMKKAGSMQ